MTTTGTKRITHYVSLDLGSDSMAAYSYEVATGQSGLIRLQESSQTHTNKDELDLLFEKDTVSSAEATLSHRLRTRIFLRDPVSSPDLPPTHAEILFLDPDGRYVGDQNHESVFRYFDRLDTANPIMPNPKLVFQMGSRQAVPELTILNRSARVRHDPAVLLQDLTVQVVNNLVLRSSILRHVPPQQIGLILTIPNVYSLTHSRQLENFVQRHAPVGDVQVIYESDALAYYVLDRSAPKRTREFCEKVIRIERRRDLKLLTIDIGRGTTDLSLIRIQANPGGAQEYHHTVLARTGVCSGGQALTYIFVQYFDERVGQAFKSENVKRPYDFTTESEQLRFEQRRTNRRLEMYIEEIKRSIDQDYSIAWVDPARADSARAELLESILAEVAAPDQTKVRDALEATLALPKDLRDPSIGSKISWRRMWKKLGLPVKPDPQYAHIHDLVRKIEEYVRTNVDDMLEHLVSIAAERDAQQLSRPGRVTKSLAQNTFVIVAGQASQFRPVHAAISRRLTRSVKKNNIHFIEDKADTHESKVACCKGAVGFLKAPALRLNIEEFFGTYGFCSAVQALGGSPFIPASTADLIRHGKTTVRGFKRGLYHLVYVVRPVHVRAGRATYVPELFDGYTSVVSELDKPDESITIEYDRSQQRLIVARKAMDVVTTHGYVDEKIQPKVWPIIVTGP